MDLGWKWLESGTVDEKDAVHLQEVCEQQAPNTEDFDSIFVSAALDAANSALNVARLLIEADAEVALEIATFARDTVDMYVQELESMPANAPDLEERIRIHPFMQRELVNQREALALASAGISFAEASAQWRVPSRSNIDLH